jgi:hypothetical protein
MIRASHCPHGETPRRGERWSQAGICAAKRARQLRRSHRLEGDEEHSMAENVRMNTLILQAWVTLGRFKADDALLTFLASL